MGVYVNGKSDSYIIGEKIIGAIDALNSSTTQLNMIMVWLTLILVVLTIVLVWITIILLKKTK